MRSPVLGEGIYRDLMSCDPPGGGTYFMYPVNKERALELKIKELEEENERLLSENKKLKKKRNRRKWLTLR